MVHKQCISFLLAFGPPVFSSAEALKGPSLADKQQTTGSKQNSSCINDGQHLQLSRTSPYVMMTGMRSKRVSGIAEVACLGVNSATPVPGTNALSGSAGYEGDAGTIVLVRGLELQGPQLTYAAQHHWQHKAVQPSRFCRAQVFACVLAVRLSQTSVATEQYRIAISLLESACEVFM